MSDFLHAMARASERRVAEARQREDEPQLRRRCADMQPPRELRLAPRGFDLFAEIKRRSPAAGQLDCSTDPDAVAHRAAIYAGAGAAVISVLTEPGAFAGTLDDLESVARAVTVPVMRKDFLVDPYQVLEARSRGASGVLLILRLLDDARLEEMLDVATETGQFVLLEAFDEVDLERAGRLPRPARTDGTRVMLGLNARDLETLQVDPARFATLAGHFPPEAIRVAESGIENTDGVRAAARLGYRAALVGSALMRAEDSGRLLGAMLVAGRAEAASCG